MTSTVAINSHRYDRALRAIIWSDLLLSAVTVVAAVLVVPVLMLTPVPASARPYLVVVLLVDAVLLGGLGALGAALLMLRLRDGWSSLPPGLRLPLPRFMRPEPTG